MAICININIHLYSNYDASDDMTDQIESSRKPAAFGDVYTNLWGIDAGSRIFAGGVRARRGTAVALDPATIRSIFEPVRCVR